MICVNSGKWVFLSMIIWRLKREDMRSTSGYFLFVGGNLVTWRSKKQNLVARLSAEVEYKRVALGTSEMLWL